MGCVDLTGVVTAARSNLVVSYGRPCFQLGYFPMFADADAVFGCSLGILRRRILPCAFAECRWVVGQGWSQPDPQDLDDVQPAPPKSDSVLRSCHFPPDRRAAADAVDKDQVVEMLAPPSDMAPDSGSSISPSPARQTLRDLVSARPRESRYRRHRCHQAEAMDTVETQSGISQGCGYEGIPLPSTSCRKLRSCSSLKRPSRYARA